MDSEVDLDRRNDKHSAAVMIHTDPHMTFRQLSTMLDISVGSVQELLKDNLNMSRVSACWISQLLTPDQKQNRVELCQPWLQCV